MKYTRFSKAAVLHTLRLRIDRLYKAYHFDPANGTAQLRPNNIARAVAYGEKEAMEAIVCAIESGLLNDPNEEARA